MIRIELTQAELTALAGLIDAGIRATGIRGVKDAAAIVAKMEAAAQAKEPTDGED